MSTPRSRREVLRILAGGVAGAAFAPSLTRGLGALSRDDVFTANARIERIGLQLYTVRKALGSDLEGTIAAVAAAGVTELEFAGYYQKPASWWREIMTKHKLTAPATHIALPASDAAWGPHFEMANQMGHQFVFVPWIGENYRGSADSWKRLADRLNAGATLARKAGLRFGYHNHDFEFAPIAGSTNGLDLMLANTDPSLVDFELDLYWAVKVGQDPLALFSKWPRRFTCCHVKDAGPPPARQMMDVGAGTIDFASILKRGRASGLEHWFIEHDQPADPLASVQASARALSRLSA